jgi:hypothetical protein
VPDFLTLLLLPQDNPSHRTGIPSHHPAMLTRIILTAILAIPSSPFGTPPWEKAPEKWDGADAYRILQDSPWCPTQTKLDTKSTARHTDRQTGRVDDSSPNPDLTNTVRGIQLSRTRAMPAIPVLWWSSRMVRLARLRLLQLRNPVNPPPPLEVPNLPDYVLVVEGGEPQRILQAANEDLHDTVFLELPDGVTLDLQEVHYVDATEEQHARTEFHFPREVDGRPTIDPDTERILFHCHASAKAAGPNQDNAISLRAEFKPRTMRVHNLPDL